jgi:hypothetical protein
LRKKKLELLEEWLQYSEDVVLLTNFRREVGRPQKRILDGRKSYRAAEKQRYDARTRLTSEKSDRHQRIIDSITATFSQDVDDIEREIAELRLRERELDSQRKGQPEGGFIDASLELRDLQCEILKLEQQIMSGRIDELEQRYENEAFGLRAKAVAQMERLNSDQGEIRDRFLRVQLHWNDAMCRNGQTYIDPEFTELEQRFAEVSDQIETIIADEADLESEMIKREAAEMQQLEADIRRELSDQDLNAIASEARLEALKKELGIDESDYPSTDLDYQTEEVARLNAALASAGTGLKAIDVLLHGENSDDVSLDERFESIRERIHVCLEPDRSNLELNKLERQLREKVQRLRSRR